MLTVRGTPQKDVHCSHLDSLCRAPVSTWLPPAAPSCLQPLFDRLCEGVLKQVSGPGFARGLPACVLQVSPAASWPCLALGSCMTE